MKRRQALKGIGLALGYSIATPSVISLLQSCKSDSEGWIPVFFTTDEGNVVKNIIELVLPKTDNSPGAIQVNVPEFLDRFSYNVLNDQDQQKLKNGLSTIIQALTQSGKMLKKVHSKEYVDLLNKFLRAKKEDQLKFKNNEKETVLFNTLIHLRDSAVWAYKSSEQVGENVLAYDPIPTAYYCEDLIELTNGKAWSL